MRRAVKQKTIHIPKSYAALIALFPLRPLQDEANYDKALQIAKYLVGRVDLTVGQLKYLDILTDYICTYEDRHFYKI